MLKKSLFTLYLITLLLPVYGKTVSVESVRFWQSPERTRVVLDLSDSVQHKTFTLAKPERVVLDLQRANSRIEFAKLQPTADLIKRVRSSQTQQKNVLRLVLDLQAKANHKVFTLEPHGQYGHRLVIDLYPNKPSTKPVSVTPEAVSSLPSIAQKRDIIVAVDAGHGGEDPGAIGGKKTYEKHITLAIAKRLAKLIDQQKGMKAVLTRTGDYAVSLRGRTTIARKKKADMFISIHADSFTRRSARGASVWVLSPRGASSEMGRWLEKKQNSADLLGGFGNVSLGDKDPMLAKVLLDLSMTHSQDASFAAGKSILGEMGRFTKLHKKTVQKAGFVVLKSPDIPSILVETAFISNPQEEKLLRTKKHQQRLASAILKGVKSYYVKHPVAGTKYAAQKHKIKKGETLSGIAQRYRVSLAALKRTNKLKNDRIKVGQIIEIPAS